MKIGLKLYSTDSALIPEALELKARNLFDFVELYAIPESFESSIEQWKNCDIPFIIHAPHSYHGINLARADMREANKKAFREVQRFADILRTQIIIVHGGNNGSIEETIHQLRLLNEKRVVLENKPNVGLLNEICIGWSPIEFRQALHEGVICGMALDFGHAICAAVSRGVNPMEFISEFMVFKPKIYHLSDGDISSPKDFHLNFGKGNFNLAECVSVLPPDEYLTIETPRRPSTGLWDFVEDVVFLRKLLAL